MRCRTYEDLAFHGPKGATVTDETINRILGVIGAVCGVVATLVSVWTARKQAADDRLQMFVTPIVTFDPVTGAAWLALEVVNTSKISLEISQVGLITDDGSRLFPFTPLVDSGQGLPHMLHPRRKVSVRFHDSSPILRLLDRGVTLVAVYAVTSCGFEVQNPSPVLEERLQSLKNHLSRRNRHLTG